MFQRLFSLAKSLTAHKSGNVLMTIALGMPALVGAAGFAVDTAQWYMWKRELQHSVDQAALGGAWAIAKTNNFDTYELRALQEFNANQAITIAFATEPTVRLADYAGGTLNSVLVSASATKRLPFSSLLTNSSTTVLVTAQASFAEGADYSACLISLAKTGTGTDIGGNADVRARCGLAALSCDDDALVIDGSAEVLTDSIVACGKVDVPAENDDVVTEGVDTLEDLYKDLDPPDNSTPQEYECKKFGSGKDKSTLAALQPGTYAGGLVVKCATTLSPGIYVIDGGTLDLAANHSVSGNGVMFVLKNGAKMKMGGEGNDNSINLSPMLAADFIGTPYADDADRYEGMLVFEDRNNNPDNPGHVFNGNSNSLIEGMMYLPSGEITINGTANVSSQCLMISAHRIHIKGGAFLETLCPLDDSTSVGSALAQVRLVA